MATIFKAEIAYMLQPFQSTEETRYYLNGFHVEPHCEKGAMIVATDGHILGACHDENAILDPKQERLWNLPKDILKACKPGGRDAWARWLILDGKGFENYKVGVALAPDTPEALSAWDNQDPELVLATGLVRPIDGTFPDWRRVVPQVEGPPGNGTYDLALLKRFERAFSTDRAKPVKVITSDPFNPALILTNRDDFFGVIMPMRAYDREGLPGWFTTVRPSQQAAE